MRDGTKPGQIGVADRRDGIRRRAAAVEVGAARRSCPLSYPASRGLARACELDHRDGRRRRSRPSVTRGGVRTASTRRTILCIRWEPIATSRKQTGSPRPTSPRPLAPRASARIIYLGGLGNPDETLSKHLRSRQETGDLLRKHHPQVIEFRASIVIGSGSLSFEMLRALVERLPVMICPRWVRVMAQPIAVEDLLSYLLEALDLPDGPSQIYEIGGPDQVSYGQIMHEYARQRGLRRWMIPVPLLTPYLSSLWLGLVTPLYARVGRKLVESLRNPTLVSNDLAARTFSVQPRSVREALARALVNEDREFAETRWSDALSAGGPPPDLGRRALRFAAGRFAHGDSRCTAGSGVCPDSPHRRPDRLVLRRLVVVAPRFSGPVVRRRRCPSRPPRSGEPAAWVMRWTSGAWNSTSRRIDCGCARK